MYDIASGYFTAVEASFEDVTGYPPNEVVLADATSFITQLVLEEHLLVISNLILHSYEICQQRKGKDESIAVHMEYNIKTKTGLNKRVIIQYTPLVYEKDGYPRITEGRISDISHFKKDGLPLLYVIADNRLVHFEQADPKDMVRSKNVLFSKKELEILKLVSEGFSIKEVAARLKTSISTIYTHRKNIRQKSQEDINKIIVDLKQRGLI
jgi:predicted DNA-binding protein (UPF0251 family)